MNTIHHVPKYPVVPTASCCTVTTSNCIAAPSSALGGPIGVARLPVEVLDHICSQICASDLVAVTRVSSYLQFIAIRILYRSIPELPPRRLTSCLKSLSKNTCLPPLVRSLKIDLSQSSPIQNFYKLLHTVLTRLTNLSFLSLEISRNTPIEPILNGCTFSLHHFSTSATCDSNLSQFLESQPSITELCLRGFSPNADTEFSLAPTALPRLSHFRAIHSVPSLVAKIIAGRPLVAIFIPVFDGNLEDHLDALTLSSRPIQRLTLMSFDTNSPDLLLRQVALRLPQIEALHIVILMANYSVDLLQSSGPFLSEFSSLKYLTFMAPGESISLKDEQDIAESWHKCCPTLQTIILPKGVVWFADKSVAGAGHWACLDLSERGHGSES